MPEVGAASVQSLGTLRLRSLVRSASLGVGGDEHTVMENLDKSCARRRPRLTPRRRSPPPDSETLRGRSSRAGPPSGSLRAAASESGLFATSGISRSAVSVLSRQSEALEPVVDHPEIVHVRVVFATHSSALSGVPRCACTHRITKKSLLMSVEALHLARRVGDTGVADGDAVLGTDSVEEHLSWPWPKRAVKTLPLSSISARHAMVRSAHCSASHTGRPSPGPPPAQTQNRE